MNPDHEIYRAPEDEIPAEDKARLDGYLAAKAEATEVKQAQEKFEQMVAAMKGESA